MQFWVYYSNMTLFSYLVIILQLKPNALIKDCFILWKITLWNFQFPFHVWSSLKSSLYPSNEKKKTRKNENPTVLLKTLWGRRTQGSIMFHGCETWGTMSHCPPAVTIAAVTARVLRVDKAESQKSPEGNNPRCHPQCDRTYVQESI